MARVSANVEGDIPDGFIHVGSSESRQGVVELSNESIPVVLGHAHECPSHDYELDLRSGISASRDEVPERVPCLHYDPMP